MMVISWLIMCLLVLLSVAFFTLFERKVMGLFHLRVGPNKTVYLGLLQPLLDAFKLLSKQNLKPFSANKLTYELAPMAALFLSLFVWMTMPSIYYFLSMNYSFIMFFCISSVMVFPVLLAGWSANSKYSLIGSLRSIAQSISYEVVFSTLMVMVLCLIMSYSIMSVKFQSFILFLFILPIWVICVLAETHRAPFDFSESESELVSGFNTEYSGMYFALVFLSEYSILLYSSMLMVYIFFSMFYISVLILSFLTLLVSFIFIWVRVTFCRFRYDMLMMMAWKFLLPTLLFIFIIMVLLL